MIRKGWSRYSRRLSRMRFPTVPIAALVVATVVGFVVFSAAEAATGGFGAGPVSVRAVSNDVSLTRDAITLGEASVLQDGEVTHEEMKQRLLAVVECVREAGFAAELTEFIPYLGWTISTSGPDEASADMAEMQRAACFDRLAARSADTYMASHRFTSEQRKQFELTVGNCLTDRGIDTRKARDVASLTAEEADVYNECAFQAIGTLLSP
ncbi:MAG: hypothetical protein KatS3mg011_0527 [Acidimicrobiia bacterium]|nr:MAG: hypothetical protein KatS3mg011_0527 [Acidimicrobiia bacterium]